MLALLFAGRTFQSTQARLSRPPPPVNAKAPSFHACAILYSKAGPKSQKMPPGPSPAPQAFLYTASRLQSARSGQTAPKRSEKELPASDLHLAFSALWQPSTPNLCQPSCFGNKPMTNSIRPVPQPAKLPFDPLAPLATQQHKPSLLHADSGTPRKHVWPRQSPISAPWPWIPEKHCPKSLL